MIHSMKWRAGDYKYPVEIDEKGERLWLKVPFNNELRLEVKAMEGAKWHGFEEPPIKKWSVKNSIRNWFQIKFLAGEPVYARFDRPLVDFIPRRKKKDYPHLAYLWPVNYDPESPVQYDHQVEM